MEKNFNKYITNEKEMDLLSKLFEKTMIELGYKIVSVKSELEYIKKSQDRLNQNKKNS